MTKTFPIITKLGGRKEVFKILQDASPNITTIDCIRMWEKRKRISRDAMLILMQVADKRNITYRFVDFFNLNQAPIEGQDSSITQQNHVKTGE